MSDLIIPLSWLHAIKTEKGKVDTKAVLLLSYIASHDQGYPIVAGYSWYAEAVGFTKREATDGLKRLKSMGLIEIELKEACISGLVAQNVPHIRPLVDAVNRLGVGL